MHSNSATVQTPNRAATTTAPVEAAGTRSPVDLDVLERLVVGWLRETRHGSPSAPCWGCPVDVAGLMVRVDRAVLAGLL